MHGTFVNAHLMIHSFAIHSWTRLDVTGRADAMISEVVDIQNSITIWL